MGVMALFDMVVKSSKNKEEDCLRIMVMFDLDDSLGFMALLDMVVKCSKYKEEDCLGIMVMFDLVVHFLK